MKTQLKRRLSLGLLLLSMYMGFTAQAQSDVDNNGLKYTVINNIQSTYPDAQRFEVARIGYNSVHWQWGGTVTIELYNMYYGTGYHKYIIEVGYQQGTGSTTPVLKLLETEGKYRQARVVLGTPTNLSTNISGAVNKQLPIFVDVKGGANYKVKVSYQRNKVSTVTQLNEITINMNPTASATSMFQAPQMAEPVSIGNNGITTSTIKGLGVWGSEVKRFHVADIGYNSHHWQYGGSIIVELFQNSYGTGYEKYHIGLSYGEGTGSTTPSIELVQTLGKYHTAKVSLGSAVDVGTTKGGYANYKRALYIDVRYYSNYSVRITHSRKQMDAIDYENQIVVYENPTSSPIADFTVDVIPDVNLYAEGHLKAKGGGTHSIENGVFAVGTDAVPSGFVMAVDGKIRTRGVKVDTDNWADHVFTKEHDRKTLAELEAYIAREKHLPNIPSAAEATREGVEVSEMLVKLLEKVEELTLYTIEQQKEIELLKKKLEEQ